MFAGLAGCFLPVIPGPPLNWIGLLLLHYTRFAEFSFTFLAFWFVVTIVVTILDFIIPVWGTRKFGGSKQGIWGATIGMIAGIFIFPPLGLIFLPFFGALAAELISGKDAPAAFHAALGSLVGFLLSTGLKFASSLLMTFYFARAFFV